MAWRRPGDKPLSEPMMVRLPTQICVTRPQWVTWNSRNRVEFLGTIVTSVNYYFLLRDMNDMIKGWTEVEFDEKVAYNTDSV